MGDIDNTKCHYCSEKKISRSYDDLEETLALFKNGKERYRTSPIFKSVILSLICGADKVEMMDSLIGLLESSIGDREILVMDTCMGLSAKHILHAELMHRAMEESLRSLRTTKERFDSMPPSPQPD